MQATRQSKLWAAAFLIAIAATFFVSAPAQLSAQTRSIPNLEYYRGFAEYYRADYRDAGRIFSRASNNGLRAGQQRFLDSVCYMTMMGECHFQVGNFSQAIELYEQALALYLDYVALDWQSRLQLPPAITEDRAAVQQARITWGLPQRNFVIPQLPDTFSYRFGEVGGVERAIAQGGVAREAELRPVDVAEVMRCAAIALHRRRYIKGVTCKYDPFSTRLQDELAKYRGGDGTLLGAWNGVLFAMAQASKGKYDSAQKRLTASLQFNGAMDHPLTPIALLELADLRRLAGNNAEAGNLALEASFSGAIFNQYDVVADAIRLGAQVHLIDQRSVYPPLEPVIAWAARENADLVEAVATIRLADCFAEMSETGLCSEALAQFKRGFGRSGVSLTPEVGRAEYLLAVVAYINGNYQQGATSLVAAIERYASGSRWLYQLNLAEQLVISGGVTERQADSLYGALLRDPTEAEWKTDPLEAMSFMLSDHLGAMERWFEIIVTRKDFARAIQVAEMLKRHRFFSSLPMGGRLLAFRWMMEAPDDQLSKEILAQRASFHARFPAYQPLSKRATQLQLDLAAKPLKPVEETPEVKEQVEAFAALNEISQVQESMLASVALRRQAADMAFPPLIAHSTIEARLAPDEIALVLVNTAATTYLFEYGHSEVTLISVVPTRRLGTSIAKLNRELQILEKQVDVDELLDPKKWHQAIDGISKAIIGPSPEIRWNGVKRVVIVPDGLTWYLPWEVLPVNADGAERKLLAQQAEIRYSPTLGLAFTKELPFHRVGRSAIFAGELYSKAPEGQTKVAAEKLLADFPGLAIFENEVKVPSGLLGTVADRFVVWSQIDRPTRGGAVGTYAAAPVQLDGKSAGNLASWLQLPFRGVQQIVMPGFVSDGGGGKSRTGGNDMFLMTTSMLGSGVRTIAINRWSTGGQAALDLSSEFLRQNKDENAVTAWHKTIQQAKNVVVDLEQEPKFKTTKTIKPITAEHPLFWSGTIVVAAPQAKPKADPVP